MNELSSEAYLYADETCDLLEDALQTARRARELALQPRGPLKRAERAELRTLASKLVTDTGNVAEAAHALLAEVSP